jgi:tetratricopeptide (TPR) repeat protein
MKSRFSNGGLREVVTGLTAAFLILFAVRQAQADFSADLSAAANPVGEGVPEVAIIRLQTLLKAPLASAQRRMVSENLVQALVAAHRADEALALITENKLDETSTQKFWHAQALAALHRPGDALPLYDAVAADKTCPVQSAAIFGAAEMLRALNRNPEAVRKLTLLLNDKALQTRTALRLATLFLDMGDLPNAERALDRIEHENSAARKERRFLRGRLDMAEHRPDHALPHFQAVVKKPHGVSHSLMIAALFQIADAHLQLKTPETGDDFLEDFIDHHPNDVALAEIFAKLDELYRAERKPVRAELERWTREIEQPRRGFAQWYLARIELRAGHRDRAVQLLNGLRSSRVGTPALAAGLFELAKLQIENGNFDEAVVIANDALSWQPAAELRDQLRFLVGQAQYAARNFQPATATFDQLSRSDSELTPASMYNASLGWLQLGDHAHFAAAYDELQKRGGNEESKAELRLQEGLLRARQRQSDAAETLRKFIADFPGSPRVSEAYVALAELAFHENPPRLEETRSLLARAASSNPTDLAKERAEYLMLWLEDSAGNNGDNVINLAKQFLQHYPASTFAPDVRMKLAETYYLRQDFSNAQTQFELFAQQNPGAPLIEKALFFAAESAMASMAPHTLDRAIVLFDQVVQMKGDLRWAARNEQASIERKLGKSQDALLLYDEVLKSDARPGDKREAICGKGDIFFELSTTDPKNYERAIAAYDQLAAAASEPGHWHNQALFKKGICLEKKADPNAALATFYQVLEAPPRADRSPELFWFYKAGFNAARLLENDSRWDSAAKVYEKLVAAGGSRSEEARVRLNRLRLEHFLWSD